MSPPIDWLAAFAASRGLRYEPDADERWIRAWEPYATLRAPLRYEHALYATGSTGSITIARLVVDVPYDGAPSPPMPPGASPPLAASWIVLAQDVRIAEPPARAAATSDPSRVFAEPSELVPMPRRATGDAAFDRVFAAFAPTDADLARAVTPSVRRLVLGWRIPLHFELRPGAFVLAPTALRADLPSIGWLVEAVQFFGEKAAKRVQ